MLPATSLVRRVYCKPTECQTSSHQQLKTYCPRYHIPKTCPNPLIPSSSKVHRGRFRDSKVRSLGLQLMSSRSRAY